MSRLWKDDTKEEYREYNDDVSDARRFLSTNSAEFRLVCVVTHSKQWPSFQLKNKRAFLHTVRGKNASFVENE